MNRKRNYKNGIIIKYLNRKEMKFYVNYAI